MLKTFSSGAGIVPTKTTVFTSSGTYTPTSGAIFVEVAVCGAGGGGFVTFSYT